MPKGGSQLSCTHGSWTAGPNGTDMPTSYTVLWERGIRDAGPADASWHTIAGATGDTYTVPADDYGSGSAAAWWPPTGWCRRRP